MSQSPSRRGFFARLFGTAAAGAAAAGTAAPPAAPLRCAHYHDGSVWRDPRGPAGSYVRDDGGCPFCSGARRAGRLSVVHDAPGRVTTYAYDAQGRPLSVTQGDPPTTFTYDARKA